MFAIRFGNDNYRNCYCLSTVLSVITPKRFEVRYPTLVIEQCVCKAAVIEHTDQTVPVRSVGVELVRYVRRTWLRVVYCA